MLALGADEGMALISAAIEQDLNEKHYMRWVNGGYERTTSFIDFKAKLTAPKDARSAEDIMAHVRGLMMGGAPDGNI